MFGQIDFMQAEHEKSYEESKVQVNLRGAKDDSAIVLSSTGSFFLLSTETDGHWTEAIVHAEEILVFWVENTDINTTVKNNNRSAALGWKAVIKLGLNYGFQTKITREKRGAESYI